MCMQLLDKLPQRTQKVQREECSKEILHPRTIRWTQPESHHAPPLEVPPERPTDRCEQKSDVHSLFDWITFRPFLPSPLRRIECCSGFSRAQYFALWDIKTKDYVFRIRNSDWQPGA